MSIILISGNGIGAGKDRLERRLRIFGNTARVALADTIRHELKYMYPEHDWLNLSQQAKDLPFDDKLTIRGKMVQYGQQLCRKNKTHWCEQLDNMIQLYIKSDIIPVVTDLRKVVELEYFRKAYPGLLHFHVFYSGAVEEKYDNEALSNAADYILESPTRI